MFDNQEELKAHIAHVKRCLQFYAQSVEELLKQGYPQRELERLIDIQLISFDRTPQTTERLTLTSLMY